MRRRDFAEWLERVWPRIEFTVSTHKLVNTYLDRIEAMK
jgi:hypothetical protein